MFLINDNERRALGELVVQNGVRSVTVESLIQDLEMQKEEIIAQLSRDPVAAVGSSIPFVMDEQKAFEGKVYPLGRVEIEGDHRIFHVCPRDFIRQSPYEIPVAPVTMGATDESLPVYKYAGLKEEKNYFSYVEKQLFKMLNETYGFFHMENPSKTSLWNAMEYRCTVSFDDGYDMTDFWSQSAFRKFQINQCPSETVLRYLGSDGVQKETWGRWIALSADPCSDSFPYSICNVTRVAGGYEMVYHRKGYEKRMGVFVGDSYIYTSAEVKSKFGCWENVILQSSDPLGITPVLSKNIWGYVDKCGQMFDGLACDGEILYNIEGSMSWVNKYMKMKKISQERGLRLPKIQERGVFHISYGGGLERSSMYEFEERDVRIISPVPIQKVTTCVEISALRVERLQDYEGPEPPGFDVILMGEGVYSQDMLFSKVKWRRTRIRDTVLFLHALDRGNIVIVYGRPDIELYFRHIAFCSYVPFKPPCWYGNENQFDPVYEQAVLRVEKEGVQYHMNSYGYSAAMLSQQVDYPIKQLVKKFDSDPRFIVNRIPLYEKYVYKEVFSGVSSAPVRIGHIFRKRKQKEGYVKAVNIGIIPVSSLKEKFVLATGEVCSAEVFLERLGCGVRVRAPSMFRIRTLLAKVGRSVHEVFVECNAPGNVIIELRPQLR